MSTPAVGPPGTRRRAGRRAVLAGLLAAPLAVPAAVACAPGPDTALTLAAGEPGGFYAEFGALLADVATTAGYPLRPVTTGGSRSNVELVERGEAAIGIALTDLVLAARAGGAPFRGVLDVLAIGRVYENYLQLAVRAESPFTRLAELDGRRVSFGSAGSGAATTAARLATAAGVRPAAETLDLTEATAALADGRIDAFLWSGGVPTPAVDELAARRPIRLLPLATHLAALRARYGTGAYSAVTVPPGVYGAPAPVPTIGVANLLLAAPALPDDAAGALARLLVTRAPDLVPASAIGTQYLDQPALVDTGDVPLHPGAATAYRDLHG
nr:TAXI family TRAP transporter solute-binding subunit [Pseudonocardia sp. HH130630-07]